MEVGNIDNDDDDDYEDDEYGDDNGGGGDRNKTLSNTRPITNMSG